MIVLEDDRSKEMTISLFLEIISSQPMAKEIRIKYTFPSNKKTSATENENI